MSPTLIPRICCNGFSRSYARLTPLYPVQQKSICDSPSSSCHHHLSSLFTTTVMYFINYCLFLCKSLHRFWTALLIPVLLLVLVKCQLKPLIKHSGGLITLVSSYKLQDLCSAWQKSIWSSDRWNLIRPPGRDPIWTVVADKGWVQLLLIVWAEIMTKGYSWWSDFSLCTWGGDPHLWDQLLIPAALPARHQSLVSGRVWVSIHIHQEWWGH